MVKSDTVHKTVRLSQEQIDFINSQGKGTFTDNLSSLLRELMTGESERARSLEQYKNTIERRTACLYKMTRYMYDCARFLTSLSHAVGQASGLEETLMEDGQPPKAPRPGNFL